jgi:ankyrin repeat protein
MRSMEAVEALHAAVRRNSPADVSAALLAGADVNAPIHGWTPLQVAANGGHTRAIVTLLAAGANPHVTHANRSSVVLEAVFGHFDTAVAALLEGGCSANAADAWGDTPLHLASRMGAVACVTELVKAGGRTDLANGSSMRPSDLVRAPPVSPSHPPHPDPTGHPPGV